MRMRKKQPPRCFLMSKKNEKELKTSKIMFVNVFVNVKMNKTLSFCLNPPSLRPSEFWKKRKNLLLSI